MFYFLCIIKFKKKIISLEWPCRIMPIGHGFKLFKYWDLYIIIGCFTRFTHNLIKWYSLHAKTTISPHLPLLPYPLPFYTVWTIWPINEFHVSNLNWWQCFTYHNIFIRIFYIYMRKLLLKKYTDHSFRLFYTLP